MALYVIKNEGGVKIDTGTSGNGLILPVVPSSSSLSGAGETGSLFYSEADGRIYAYGASGWSPNIGQTGEAGSSGTSGTSGGGTTPAGPTGAILFKSNNVSTGATGFIFHSGTGSLQQGPTAVARGLWSHAEGDRTTAISNYSHAEGIQNTAGGTGSHAEGYTSSAFGDWSHAEGVGGRTTGGGSHAEGIGTLASGYGAHAEGFTTTASGNQSHAEGGQTIAIGNQSHAEGSQTTSVGTNSHAEGINTTSKASFSLAAGSGTISAGLAQVVVGAYNIESSDGNDFFIVGGGTSSSERGNVAKFSQTAVNLYRPLYINGTQVTAGGSAPTYFTYNAGTLNFSTSWQTLTIPTGTITVDNTRKFQVDFWGSLYYPADFFGEMMDNQGAFYGQPVFRWTDNWSGTKTAVNYGSTNTSGGQQARITYPGTGTQLQLQYKSTGALNGVQLNIYATLTYL